MTVDMRFFQLKCRMARRIGGGAQSRLPTAIGSKAIAVGGRH